MHRPTNAWRLTNPHRIASQPAINIARSLLIPRFSAIHNVCAMWSVYVCMAVPNVEHSLIASNLSMDGSGSRMMHTLRWRCKEWVYMCVSVWVSTIHHRHHRRFSGELGTYTIYIYDTSSKQFYFWSTAPKRLSGRSSARSAQDAPQHYILVYVCSIATYVRWGWPTGKWNLICDGSHNVWACV